MIQDYRARYILPTGLGLVVVRIPPKGVRWRVILKALTPVAHSYGKRQLDLGILDGYAEHEEPFKRAFDGDTAALCELDLWDWDGTGFQIIRKARPEPTD